MRIIGIDPGYAIVGYGVLDFSSNHFTLRDFGAITTSPELPLTARLLAIYNDMKTLLDIYQPQELSIEKLFSNTNQKTVIDVAQARGVTLLPAIQRGIPVYEYTPLQVKSSIVGYGRAEKKQVQELVRTILGLKECPKPDDAADAVALAMTHAYSLNTRRLLNNAPSR